MAPLCQGMVATTAPHSQTVTRGPSMIKGTRGAFGESVPRARVAVVPEAPTVSPIPSSSPLRLYQPAPAAPAGQFAAPLPSGPITGYGPGGMAHEPGTPANPPWSYG